MDENQIKYFVEAALLAAGRPLSIDQLQKLFDADSMPEKSQIRQAIKDLLEDYADRGITIGEVASGFRIQVESDMVQRLQKLWEERAPRYSRALFETLALIAYRQPMTRGEIEEIRGVSVSPNIIRSLLEREWVRVVGHRDVPGRPEMFGTTRQFLDYFGLKKLEDLPSLADVSDWESLRVQLNLPAVEEEQLTAAVTELQVVGSQNDEPETASAVETEKAVEMDDAGDSSPPAGEDDAVPAETTEVEDIEVEATAVDIDFEPIEASEWPKPNAGMADIAAADVNDLREETEDQGDPESSATGG